MQVPDIQLMSQYVKYADVSSWSQTRQLMLSVLRPYLKKKDITAQELLPLPIDDNYKEEHTTEISNEDVNWYNNFIQQNKGEH